MITKPGERYQKIRKKGGNYVGCGQGWICFSSGRSLTSNKSLFHVQNCKSKKERRGKVKDKVRDRSSREKGTVSRHCMRRQDFKGQVGL